MNVHDEFTRRVAADRLCRELARAIAENDTAALERLGMRGFGLYAGRLSELMTDSVRRELLGTDDFAGTDFGAIMGEVAKPAHYAHHLVNEGGSAIQQALDRRNGVRLRVVEPEFNDGRLKGIVGEASESDSENAADNLATQLGTFVKDMGNEFMRQNAEQRDRAGFKVTITRTGGAKCCPWCADRTGKWELANAPDGVFGCHDNCKCMVDYTNSKGAVSRRVGRSRFVDVPYEPPHVLSREEAREKGGFDEPKRLTGEKLSKPSSSGDNTPFTFTAPQIHSAEEYAALEAYARERGIRIYNIGRFDGDIELLKEQIEAIDEARKEFEITNHRIAIRFGLLDDPNQDLAETNKRGDCIEFNYFALRDRKTTEKFMNSDNSLAATKAVGIAFHEMGHVISIKRGEIGLDIAEKAYYNIFKKTPSRSELLAYLENDISDYSTALRINASKPYVAKDFKEITPEIYSKNKTNPSEFTNEFVRLLKEAYGL